jgi:ATP-dependent Clp protease ATP-binding subunit ClpC
MSLWDIRFTDRARKILDVAEQEARRLNHPLVAPEHLLLGMLVEGKGVAGAVLKNLGVDLEEARAKIRVWEPAPPGEGMQSIKLPMNELANNTIELSMEECRNLNHHYAGTEHLLLGLCRLHEGLATRVLQSFGLKLEDVRQEVLNLLGHGV